MYELTIQSGEIVIVKTADNEKELKRLIYLYNGDSWVKNEALYKEILEKSEIQKNNKQ